jgi:nucleotide-binding universal stress UspA family protein
MTAPHPVLVPLDGSACATGAIPVAQRLAGLFHATVVLLHIVDDVPVPATLIERMNLSADDVHGFIIEHRRGVAEEVILQEAAERHAAAIVMCSQTHTDIQSRIFGHVAKPVFRGARCPVVLVPPGRGRQPWDLLRVVVPHDGTPTSAVTIEPAADLAARSGAELVVLHVARPVRAELVEPGTFLVPSYVDQPHHEWNAWMREFVDRMCAVGGARSDTRIRMVVAEGEADAAIVRFARQSDLIVLGWRGVLEPDRALTLRRVIRDTSCPVMVFRLDRAG